MKRKQAGSIKSLPVFFSKGLFSLSTRKRNLPHTVAGISSLKAKSGVGSTIAVTDSFVPTPVPERTFHS